MGKGCEVRIYYNPRWYTPLGNLKEKVDRADAKLQAGKPGYQEGMEAQIAEINKKAEAQRAGK